MKKYIQNKKYNKNKNEILKSIIFNNFNSFSRNWINKIWENRITLDKYLKKPEKNSYKKLNNLRSDIALTTIAAIVGAACAIYKVGVYLFGYKKTVEFNDIPMERGFEYFD